MLQEVDLLLQAGRALRELFLLLAQRRFFLLGLLLRMARLLLDLDGLLECRLFLGERGGQFLLLLFK